MYDYSPHDRSIGYEYDHQATLQERVFFEAFGLFHAQEAKYESDGSAALEVTFADGRWFGDSLYQRMVTYYAPMDDEGNPEAVSLVLFDEAREVASCIITLQRSQKCDNPSMLFTDMTIPDDPGSLTVMVDDMFPTVFTEGGEIIDDETTLERILEVLDQSRMQLTFLSKDVA